MCYDQVRQLIKESNKIVVLSGSALYFECGLKGVRQEECAYDIEARYGYSPEEIASIEFLNRRVNTFYKYYREEVIDLEHMRPNQAHWAIAELEKQGKLSAVITREVYGLHQMAGVHKMMELQGNVNKNICPKCRRRYEAEYVVKSDVAPVCENCRVILKPGITLYGEPMNNGLMTKATEAVENCDMLLIIGNSTQSNLTSFLLQYYKGDRLVTINDKPAVGDECANYTLYGECEEILAKLVWN